ncbi:DUF2062 domain-containing protein [Natronolimnobius baerhuensis]|uniref:DUF2062 domain-containing protein n=1 Tax=Natronolimnobius baerhuensis TaxID=253108 RepID=A0A202EDW0_9EURY|nr:DUF2062 domain-containing protein [Natronolimnobius baerhuensis]OVE86446.1 hypothetical protein B2G88_04665 [Natronolimnobius baerhuensis]
MVREQLALYRDRTRQRLEAAFREEHTPHQVGASFSIGIFVTALPTGGLGIGLFFVFTSLWSWISKPALFASIAVLNPFIKPAVYVSSFQLGGWVLGTSPLHSPSVSPDVARDAIRQLLVGNLIIALILSALSYVVVRHLTRIHRRRSLTVLPSPARSRVREWFRR